MAKKVNSRHVSKCHVFCSARVADAGECVLYGGGDVVGVAVGDDGERPIVHHLHERRGYVLRHRLRDVAPVRHLAVLYVSPHRRLGPHVLCLHHH
jgi:hypothetical protein